VHTSPVGREQADWLEKALVERQDHPNVFVVNHVPCYPSFRNPKGRPATDTRKESPGTGELQRKHWVPLFEKHRVPVVLEHHDHTFKRTKKMIGEPSNENGVLYLGDGSWGRIRIPKTPDQIPTWRKSAKIITFRFIESQEKKDSILRWMRMVASWMFVERLNKRRAWSPQGDKSVLRDRPIL
jgi:hypothetical protein